MTLSEAAAALPLMQLSRYGAVLPVEQVDLVEAEDGEHIMAYVYDAAENCLVILLDKTENFDAAHVRHVLAKPRVVH